MFIQPNRPIDPERDRLERLCQEEYKKEMREYLRRKGVNIDPIPCPFPHLPPGPMPCPPWFRRAAPQRPISVKDIIDKVS